MDILALLNGILSLLNGLLGWAKDSKLVTQGKYEVVAKGLAHAMEQIRAAKHIEETTLNDLRDNPDRLRDPTDPFARPPDITPGTDPS